MCGGNSFICAGLLLEFWLDYVNVVWEDNLPFSQYSGLSVA